MGDVTEQICARQDVMRSRRTLDALLHLYQDSATGAPKSGCTSYAQKGQKLANGKWSERGKGGIRRLIVGVLPRLKLTYNTELMDVPSLVNAAGPEFSTSRWNTP